MVRISLTEILKNNLPARTLFLLIVLQIIIHNNNLTAVFQFLMLLIIFLDFGHLMKDSDAGRDWGQEEKGTTEDEMAGWHHRLVGRESE